MFGFQRTLRDNSWSSRALALGVMALGLSGCVAPGHDQAAPLAMTGAGGSGRITDLPPSQIASLENLSAPELVARLGPPDFRRQDPPAELWQYRGATCVLDLFLYPDGPALKVARAQSRIRRAGPEAVGLSTSPCSPFSPEDTASTS